MTSPEGEDTVKKLPKGIKRIGKAFDAETRRFGDTNSYRYIELDNGLECLLVSSNTSNGKDNGRRPNAASTHSGGESDESVSMAGTESPSSSERFKFEDVLPPSDSTSSSTNRLSYGRVASRCSTGRLGLSNLEAYSQLSPMPVEAVEAELRESDDFTSSENLLSSSSLPVDSAKDDRYSRVKLQLGSSQFKKKKTESLRNSKSISLRRSVGNNHGSRMSALGRLSKRMSVRLNHDNEHEHTEQSDVQDVGLPLSRTGSFVEKVHMTVTGHEETEATPESLEGEEGSNELQSIRKKDVVAASMTVGAGYFDDPYEHQGLAHFLEHMIFMGSENYENQNEFREYLSEVGGSTNAVTMAEKTEFRFSCSSQYLQGALERFADCFRCPLLTEAAARKEIESIESEFAIAKSREQVQLNLIRSATSRPGTPFQKFNYGNKRSLLGTNDPVKAHRRFPSLANKIRDFHDEHYVAPKMRFCVQGHQSLDELQEAVVGCFGGIRSSPQRPHKSRASGARPRMDVRWPSRKRFNNKRFPFSYLPELPPVKQSLLGSVSSSFVGAPGLAAKMGMQRWIKVKPPPRPRNEEVSAREAQLAAVAKAAAEETNREEDGEAVPLAVRKNATWFRKQVRKGRTLGTIVFAESETPGFHVIHLSWQLPSQLRHYDSNPSNYIAHLIGHEAAGSISAKLKAQGLGTYLMAGVTPVNSFGSNAVCSLFTVSVVLTDEGMSRWEEVVGMVFGYLVMLRQVGPQERVFREIVRSQELAYNFEDGLQASKLVTSLSCRMQAKSGVRYEDFLRGPRESQWRPKAISRILEHLVPVHCRIEVVSAVFRQGSLRLGQHVLPRVRSALGGLRSAVQHGSDTLITRVPGRLWCGMQEPHTRAKFWVTPVYPAQLQRWRDQAEDMVGNLFSLPPHNPFMPAQVCLFDPEPFVRCRPVVVPLAHLRPVDQHRATAEAGLVLGSLRQEGGQRVFLVGPASAEGKAYPLRLVRSGLQEGPERTERGEEAAREVLEQLEPEAHHLTNKAKNPARLYLPQREENLQVYFLQDGHFGTPRVQVRVSVYSPWIRQSPANAAATDVLLHSVEEAITASVYGALLAGMTVKLAVEGTCVVLSCSGFVDSVLLFLREVLTKLLSCNVAGFEALGYGDLTADKLRLHKAMLSNEYNVKNSRAMKSEIMVASSWSNEAKKRALKKVTVKAVQECARSIFKHCSLRVLMFGNCTSSHAFALADALGDLMQQKRQKPCPISEEIVFQLKNKPLNGSGLMRLRDTWFGGPLKPGIQIPRSWKIRGMLNVYSRSYESTSVILYYQFGMETPEVRIWMKLTELLMKEMLFFELRTKAQIGYVVSCHTSSVYDVGSFTIIVQSHKVDAVSICYLVDLFLENVYRKAITEMSSSTFRKQLAAVAHLLMEANSSANTQTDRYWEGILRSHSSKPPQWNREEQDGRLARANSEVSGELSKEWYLAFFDRLLSPRSPHRLQLVHFIVGVKSNALINEKLSRYHDGYVADPEEMEKHHYASLLKAAKRKKRATPRLQLGRNRQKDIRAEKRKAALPQDDQNCTVM